MFEQNAVALAREGYAIIREWIRFRGPSSSALRCRGLLSESTAFEVVRIPVWQRIGSSRNTKNRKKIAAVLKVFPENGIDAVVGGYMNGPMADALEEAEQIAGKPIICIITPHFNIKPCGPSEMEPEQVFDDMVALRASFCMAHQCVTDALVDNHDELIRDLGIYTNMIREREMVPGLSNHMPKTIPYSDRNVYDVEAYIQIYNAGGFLMQVEADWMMRTILGAAKPIMTIKPLAAGRLSLPVGLAFVWNTIRDQDMVTIGCTTPNEAREVIEISSDLLDRRKPKNELQKPGPRRLCFRKTLLGEQVDHVSFTSIGT